MFFKISIFFWVKISFIEKQNDDVDDVISLRMNVCWITTSSLLKIVRDVSFEFVEYKIDFMRHISKILFFFAILILHWKNQIKWLFSQLTHFLLSIDILHAKSLCDSEQIEHRFSYRQILSICSYFWQLKHCLILQLLTNSSQIICVYSWSRCLWSDDLFAQRCKFR